MLHHLLEMQAQPIEPPGAAAALWNGSVFVLSLDHTLFHVLTIAFRVTDVGRVLLGKVNEMLGNLRGDAWGALLVEPGERTIVFL